MDTTLEKNLNLESDSDLESNDNLSITEKDEENDSTLLNLMEDKILDEPLKKKRGRKPKDKSNIIEVEKIQKKRGRKPKEKSIEETNEAEKIPKKRGRKPKEKIYSVKEIPKTFFDENKNETYILHLPIKTSEEQQINQPLPNTDDNNYSMYNNFDDYQINNDNLLLTQKDLLNEELDVKKENKIEEENDLKTIKTNKIIKKNLRNILYEFIQSNNDKEWPIKTNIHCWWCCHQFNNIPCAMPEYYKKEKFYVIGCFCSFNCAAAYNFNKNDNEMWERYSLLNLMYKKLYNEKFIKIELAPPREVLKMFGGYMSIEEYRESLITNDKLYTVIKPPLVSIIPKIEENAMNKNFKSLTNENILNKTQNSLKLKRSKPITDPNNTLQTFMDLKII